MKIKTKIRFIIFKKSNLTKIKIIIEDNNKDNIYLKGDLGQKKG